MNQTLGIKRFYRLAAVLVVLFAVSGCSFIPLRANLPDGVDYKSPEYSIPGDDVEFLRDLTYVGADGEVITDQQIFNKVFDLIDEAKEYILIDMFLFNSYSVDGFKIYRPISQDLTEKLIEKKKACPDIRIDFIADEINTVYGGSHSKELDALEAAGINVVMMELSSLPDSNPAYSIFWRLFVEPWGNTNKGGRFENPFSKKEPDVPLRSYLELFNFKANHRKVFMCDNNGSATSVIMSANAHNLSSAHSNVALLVNGDIANDVYVTEQTAAELSDATLQPFGVPASGDWCNGDDCVNVQLVTEHQIKKVMIDALKRAGEGDEVMAAVFYLSSRDVIRSLASAAKRGADVRLILDPNKDAFGHEKNGIPNRQVGPELLDKSKNKLALRWYDTHGEQFHTKMFMAQFSEGDSVLMMGSSNFTRRNIENYNLETDLKVTASSDAEVMREVRDYYDMIWNNEDGNHYTVEFEKYEERSFFKRIKYLFEEYSGISTY